MRKEEMKKGQVWAGYTQQNIVSWFIFEENNVLFAISECGMLLNLYSHNGEALKAIQDGKYGVWVKKDE